MAQQQVRISESVHAELVKRKQELGLDSFDETLRRVLGLVPGAEQLDQLVAYLPEELQTAVNSIVEIIQNTADVHAHVEEGKVGYGDNFELVFTDLESNYDIAAIEFDDDSQRFNFYFRDTKGEWEQAAAGEYLKREDKIRYGDSGTGVYDHIEQSDVEDTVRQAVSGALQRWRD